MNTIQVKEKIDEIQIRFKHIQDEINDRRGDDLPVIENKRSKIRRVDKLTSEVVNNTLKHNDDIGETHQSFRFVRDVRAGKFDQCHKGEI